jgi:hypothetical protein
MFVERCVGHSDVNKEITSFRGQTSRAKMTSPGGKLTALVCHPTKKVNKAEELTYFYTKVAPNHRMTRQVFYHCATTSGLLPC